jgi:hypothetical protein
MKTEAPSALIGRAVERAEVLPIKFRDERTVPFHSPK